ncbi:short-chain fatty acyl-CoA regulator family protein [Rubrivivax gelatinosus]|uniref:Cro/Cl family transcriptional regulator n=1 Tax=Rubrivivax gelatinosus TaxID=28068 RepID=A0ABS1DZB1_RUBGE|nr:short-chain fatty acyl-CoA regulator family protein [Rubrivivax gelatinosus]MBK1714709.1 Cro/Cl family transcriptional regulator [Rubrivivax gelatinosus]
MRKTFMGVRLRTLRERTGLTQAALAARLGLSPSYVNQLENNQRPLSVPVLLKLQSALGVDLQWFSEDEESRLIAQLQDALADVGPNAPVAMAELQAVAQQMPALARRIVELHRQAGDARLRLELLAGERGDRSLLATVAPVQPHEEVRDFFYTRHNHVAELDVLAERLHAQLEVGSPSAAELAPALQQRLARRHGVGVQVAAPDDGGGLRRFDPASRTLRLNPDLDAGQRSFQMAVQLAFLEAGELVDRLAADGELRTDEARALARIGLASYFAGALVLPYGSFLAAAEALGYDIELLARRFGVGFETVCHRLSTLQRPDARGVPFFFIRVDRAGNISKRQSATDFHFSRTGGTCPLWKVYEAFAQPDKVLTQLAQMPDGRNYLWIARSVTHADGGYGQPARRFALALGCDARHAPRLVYGRHLAPERPETAVPIGPGCKVCERRHCSQRAWPALGRALKIDENTRPREPYAPA